MRSIAWRKYSLWYLGFVLLALLVTWPAVLTPVARVMGGTTGDNFEMLRNIWWFKFALQTGQPLYYQTLLGYPQGFSSLLLAANQLQFLPAYLLALVLPLVLAYNLTVWLTLAFNGWAMAVLMRDLLGEDAPALFAGVIFATAPTLQGHLAEGHAGLLVMWPVPLFLWALLRALKADQHVWQWGLLAIIFFNLSPSGHLLQAIYVLLPLLGTLLLWLIWRRDGRALRRLLVIIGLAGGFMGLFLLPMLSDTIATSAYTEVGGVVRYSADLLSPLSPSFYHPLWQGLPWTRAVLGTNLAEGSSYMGLVVLGLAILAVWRRPQARVWLGLAIVAFVLSLGSLLKIANEPVMLNLGDYQTFVPLPWALVQDLFGFSLARTPGRFNFTLALALALLAGYGVSVLWQWGQAQHWSRTVRWGGLVALAALSVFDTQMFWPLPTRDAQIPPAVYDLRQQDEAEVVFDVPWQHLLAAKEALYLQTAHEQPLLAGQITRQTPVDPARLNVLQQSLSPELLRQSGVRTIIFHRQRAQEIGEYETLSAALSAWGAPTYQDDEIAIYRVPAAARELTDVLVATPAGDFSSAYTSDFYAAEVGWVDFSATLTARTRRVTLLLDDVAYQTLQVDGRIPFRVSLPIEQVGFHRVSLRLDPACPSTVAVGLICSTLTVEEPQLTRADNEFLRPQIAYAKGVTLAAASVTQTGDALTVRLWWTFQEALAADRDVRFVHVLPSTGGQPLAQQDKALGDLPAGSQFLEQFTLELPTLPAGEYSVRVGWYSFPDLTRLEVPDDAIPGAADRAPEIATIQIE